jgi:hypothetical protein
MKRIISIGLAITLFASTALAGGIWTNTNQSAQFIRTLNRNASTCVDAVYFNPAGLTKLEDGIHLHFSNQSIFQTKEVTPVTAGITYLQETYVGDVAAPLFPDVYAVYKSGNLAIGGGFMPIGGGGSADYPDGLPSFEAELAGIHGRCRIRGLFRLFWWAGGCSLCHQRHDFRGSRWPIRNGQQYL